MFLKKGKRENSGKFRGFLKSGLVSLLSAVMLGTMCPIPAEAASVSTKTDESSVDFVLLLDCSGTMNQNDKEGWTAQATQSFVDFIGETNTRLSVITFGYDYGSEAYPVGQADILSKNRVKEAFPLQPVTEKGKKEAKKAIKTETSRDTVHVMTMTPLGYALNAATEILKDGDALDNHAVIVVLSDGLVEGQGDYSNKKTKQDYKSLDKAKKTAAEHGWPIYAMELNYSGKSEGKHTMREVLPGTYGNTTTKAYEVQSASKATAKLEEIYSSFFNTELTPVTDGKFKVEEMTAEETLALTGEVEKLSTVELISPSGKSETYKYADGDVSKEDRKITFSETSATIKMIMPEEGQWTLKIDGREQVTLDLEINAISLKEMNLVLSTTDAKDGDSINYGKEIHFESYFEYNGKRYESETFYKKFPAKLNVAGKSITMDTSATGYTGSCRFEQKGSFVVQSVVESNIFREGNRKSGSFTFNVENALTQPKGEIAEQSSGIGETSETINLNDYFQDDDPLTFSVKKQNSDDDYEYSLFANGELCLTAGNTSDIYTVTAYANDGSGEADAVQRFTYNVVNKPIQLIGDDELNLEMAPGDEETIYFSEYFVDPDGAAPDVRIVVEEADDSVSFDDTVEGQLTIKTAGAGAAKMTVVGIDGNTEEVMQFILVNVTAMSALAAFVHNFKWLIILLIVLVIAVIIFLAMMLTGKKIFGEWDVECNGAYEPGLVFANYKAGKKAVASLNRLIIDAGMDGDFPRVELVAGNRFNKAVFIRNLAALQSVYLDGDQLQDFNKKNVKIELKNGHTIILNSDYGSITLSRVKL